MKEKKNANPYFKFARKINVLFLALITVLSLTGCSASTDNPNKSAKTNETVENNTESTENAGSNENISKENIPSFDGVNYDVIINNNKTYFTDDEMTTSEYIKFADLDSLNRCGSNIACVSNKTVANEERGSIGMYKPSGWHTIRYDDVIKDKYLYNRSHIIMFKLYGNETNNEKNLITGTRYFNANEAHGMLHYEMLALNYVKNSGNHLMYRCTPIYEGDNLVASGILMEANSVEDNGVGLEYCVFVYNEQPGITIDHSDGKSHKQTQEELDKLKENDNSSIAVSGTNYPSNGLNNTENSNARDTQNNESDENDVTYVLNTSSKKIHLPSCSVLSKTSEKNKENTSKSKEELENEGYSVCKICNP